MFIVRENMRGCSYKVGDFIIIHRVPVSSDRYYYFTTPGTVKGDISCSSGGAEWLNGLLDKGIISYEGNLK